MDYIMWIWLGLLIAFVVFEIITTSLTTIWFAGGALVAFIMSIFKLPWWSELIAFCVISLLLLIFTRPFVTKLLKVGENKTNVDSLIGCRAKVIVGINNAEGIGYAVVNGQDWSARAEKDSDIIEEGAEAEIVGITGVKLILRPLAKNE